MKTGSTNKDVRILNRGLILKQISTTKEISRVDLANKTSLTKTTVSNVVQELIEHDFVKELAYDENTVVVSSGRRPVMLTISEKAPYICGILLKRGRTVVLFGTLQGEIIDSITKVYKGRLNPDNLYEFIISSYNDLRKKHKNKILAVGISCVGLIDSINGMILNPHNFFEPPYEMPIVRMLKKEIKKPIYLIHDTNASILAEQLYNSEDVPDDFIFLTLDSGIGMGFVLNAKVYNGRSGQSGEFGHTSINFMGERCSCGNRGCLELYAGFSHMLSQLDGFRKDYPNHPFYKKEELFFSDFIEYAEKGDIVCNIILRKYAEYVSFAIINVINLLDVDTVLLEYKNSKNIKSTFLEKIIEEQVNKTNIASKYKKISIRQSKLGNKLSLVSTIAIVASLVFSGDFKLWY